MTTLELFSGYCIDTSALIDLWRRNYPRDIFKSLWNEIEDLISYRRLVAPREVLKELEKQDDELLVWAKKNLEMFIDLDVTQMNQVKRIVNDFLDLVDSNKDTPDADPFVIALAMAKGWPVVTSEKRNPSGRPKIPDVCEEYNIRCFQLIDFFREEKWEF